MTDRSLILIFLSALIAVQAGAVAILRTSGETPRREVTVEHFRKEHPCPATGQREGPCPGWVVDHIRPLCFGGADAPSNMTWQAKEVSLVKDAFERDACALQRRCPK